VVNGVATFFGCSINLGSSSYYTLSATSSPAWTTATSSAFLIGTAGSTISSGTAIGQTQSALSFSHTTKVVPGRAWITVRFETSPALAGRTFGVWVARKTNGVWSAFAPHTQEAVVSPVAAAEEARVDGCPPDAVTVNSNVVRDEVFGSNQASLAS
jgi:hypothetical protein